jgi:NAD(P)H dehydrogenase (quinone)
LPDVAAAGVNVRHVDFDDASSLERAFEGVTRLLLISTDVVQPSGRRVEQHRHAVAAAERAGVQHLLYTSMPNPYGSPMLLAPDHVGTEDAIVGSSLPNWTVLRNHWYFENLYLSLPSALRTGEWYSAAGDGRVAHLARADVAKATAAALVTTVGGKRVCTLSGPKAHTNREIAELVGGKLGRSIRVIDVSPAELERMLAAAGLPEHLAALFASFDQNTAYGRVGEVTPDLEALSGVAPQGLESWLDEQRSSLLKLVA